MKPRILVIDDSQDTRDLFREFLPHYVQGAEVLCAESGEEGLEVAREQIPDLILLDANMPGIDGFETCKQLRLTPATATTPIIMVSAVLMEPDHRHLGFDRGADGYICKPFDNEEVATQVKGLLRIKVHEDELRRRQQDLEETVQRQQARLEERETEIQNLFDHSPDAIFVESREGVVLDANRAACEFHGLSHEKLIGSNVLDLVPAEQRDAVAHAYPMWITHELHRYEGFSQRADGTVIPVEVRAAPISYRGQEALLLHVRDITEWKRAQSELQEHRERLTERVAARTRELQISEESFHSIVEQSADGIVVLDNAGIIAYANKAAGILLDKPDEDITGQEFGWYVSPGGTSEIDVLRPNMDNGVVELTMTETSWEGESAQLVMLRDITQRRQMENKLIQTQKLESVGMLAGGIAHDFNNILTGIIGNLSLAKIDDDTPEERGAAIAEAEKSAMRAKLLTQQLLTFAKGGSPIKETASITEILHDASQFVLTGSASVCTLDAADDLWAAEVDRSQISQVIENLVINADQATPNGGTITLTATNVDLRTGDPDCTPLMREGEYVRIQIRDEGVGIPEQNLRRIFDPYFTTKRHGSGLGLATAYSIIRKHEGDIHCASVLGEGTLFTLLLPATREQPVNAVSTDESPARGRGRVLVMDDEKIVRDVAGRALTTLGYEPTLCASGEEALALYRHALDRKEPFDCVVLDLTVPGAMGGKETLTRLKQVDANVKALVSSGYSDEPVVADPESYGFKGAVPKPYNVRRLGQAVRQVIG